MSSFSLSLPHFSFLLLLSPFFSRCDLSIVRFLRLDKLFLLTGRQYHVRFILNKLCWASPMWNSLPWLEKLISASSTWHPPAIHWASWGTDENEKMNDANPPSGASESHGRGDQVNRTFSLTASKSLAIFSFPWSSPLWLKEAKRMTDASSLPAA